MSEPARNRFALDLEDLERQLRGAAHAPKPGQASDPLAELTRIVGQDDPLKELFGQRPKPAPVEPAVPSWQASRQEPSFAPTPEPAPVAANAAPPAEMRGALDEFEALLRRNETVRTDTVVAPAPAYAPVHDDGFDLPAPAAHGRSSSPQPAPDAPRDLDQEAGAYPYAYEQAEAQEPQPLEDDMPDLEPRRSRKGLWAAAAVVAIGAIGVGGAMMYRSPGVTKDGQPLVISADKAPTKVEPANPGGAEIPNQNKQIYEKVGQAQPTQTKVVSREEQPVDVQAARTQQARVVLPGPGTAGSNSGGATNPLAQAPAVPDRVATPAEPTLTPVPAVPGLGEPRKVRTVAIRPDGTPAPVNGAASATGSQPSVTGSAPAKLSPAAAAPAPTGSAVPTPKPRPATTPDTAKVQERVATPAPATTPSAPVKVANAAPAVLPAAIPSVSPAAPAVRSGSGDFTVQLAAPGSESEARATFAALQRKYPDQLGSQAPIVRKTELAGGKTVFRLRVGPYSRDDATTMCTALQSAGGQCFIAKN
jgi:hypothetical protein